MPEDDIFILDSIELFISRGTTASSDENSGTVTVQSGQSHAQPQGVRTRSAAQRFSLISDAGARGVGASHASFVPHAVYRRLRQRSSHLARIPPSGREAAEVVVELRPRADDSVLADHGSDHLSAMAIITALERAVIEHLENSTVNGMSVRFISYAEHSPEPLIYRMSRTAPSRFEGVVSQVDAVCAVVEGTVSLPEAAR